MNRKFASIFLAVLLTVLSAFAPAFAESTTPSFTLTNLTVTVYDQAFTLPMSVTDFKAAGMPLPELDMLAEGTYYPSVSVDLNEDISFRVQVSYCNPTPTEMWVDGITLNSDNCPGASIGGFVLGETTRGQVTDALGADRYDNIEASELTYYAYHINYSWNLTFESADAGAKLTRVIASSDIVNEYGCEFSAEAGVQAANLPDPASMNWNEYILDGKHYAPGSTLQTMLDNGWKLPASSDPASEVQESKDIWVYGEHLDLYNGKTMAHASVYNYTDAVSPLNKCLIEAVSVELEDNTVLILAGGLQAGVSTLADVEALLGAAVDTEDNIDGTVSYEYEAMEGQITVTATDDGDGLIDALAIEGVHH